MTEESQGYLIYNKKFNGIGCPKELQLLGGNQNQGVVGCRSACEAFKLDKYCCSGEFANPNTCKPSYYSTIFKKACPRAYSYAFDDGTSTFTCKAYEYDIVFCPNSNGYKLRIISQFRLVSFPFQFIAILSRRRKETELTYYIPTQDEKTKCYISSSTNSTALPEASPGLFLIKYFITLSSANLSLRSHSFLAFCQTWSVI